MFYLSAQSHGHPIVRPSGWLSAPAPPSAPRGRPKHTPFPKHGAGPGRLIFRLGYQRHPTGSKRAVEREAPARRWAARAWPRSPPHARAARQPERALHKIYFSKDTQISFGKKDTTGHAQIVIQACSVFCTEFLFSLLLLFS